MICASCLARLAARASSTARPANGLAPPEGERRRGRRGLAWVGHGVRLAAAILVLWFFFYGLGRGLLLMPDAFHEGVLWQRDLWYEE